MAEDTKYIDDEPVSIYFYVNKDTGVVDAIFTFNLIAMAIRRDNTWDTITREEPEFGEYINSNNWDVWKLEWGKGEEDIKAADLDPEDAAAWDPTPIQAWDRGEQIDTEMLKKYAYQVEVNNTEPNQEQ